jgi:hypothetical protein
MKLIIIKGKWGKHVLRLNSLKQELTLEIMSQSRQTGTIICIRNYHMCVQTAAYTQHKHALVLTQSRSYYTTSSAYVYVCALNLTNSSEVYTLNNKQVTILIQV